MSDTKSIRSVKNWVMRCWHGYLSGARCRWFAYGPADATATPSSLASFKSRMVLPFLCRLTQTVSKSNCQEGSDTNFVSLTVRIDGLSDVTLIVTVICGLQTQKFCFWRALLMYLCEYSLLLPVLLLFFWSYYELGQVPQKSVFGIIVADILHTRCRSCRPAHRVRALKGMHATGS